jgi:hypothetical protein
VEVAYRSQQRTSRAVLNTVLVAMLLIGVVAFAYIVPSLVHRWAELSSNLTGLEAIGAFLAAALYEAVVAYMLWLSLQHRGRAPVRLEIRSDSFTLLWADGCSRNWNWTSLRNRLELSDLSMNDTAVKAQLKISMIGFCVLTKDACDAIEEAARLHGMRVDVKESPPVPGVTLASRDITIRPPSAGRGHQSG